MWDADAMRQQALPHSLTASDTSQASGGPAPPRNDDMGLSRGRHVSTQVSGLAMVHPQTGERGGRGLKLGKAE